MMTKFIITVIIKCKLFSYFLGIMNTFIMLKTSK